MSTPIEQLQQQLAKLNPATQPDPFNIEKLVETKVAEALQKQAQQVPQPTLQSNALQAVAYQLAMASLKPEEVMWLADHASKGAPGLQEFLQSDSIKTVMQMLFETYKDFLEGKVK